MKIFLVSLLCSLLSNGLLAQSNHLTLRIEDGLPARADSGVPITLAIPLAAGTGGMGAGLAPFAVYGPYTIDATGLTRAGDTLTGTVSATTRAGTAGLTWTIDATIHDARVTGTATAPAVGRAAAVNSRVTGWLDAPTGGEWIIECGLPWTDGGSHAKLNEGDGNFGEAFVIRLRFAKSGATVVSLADSQTNSRTIESRKITGTPEQFIAEITFVAQDGTSPVHVKLEGGRIGRGGRVQASLQSEVGRQKQWAGPATVWAWPDAPGFVGGPEQAVASWQHDAEPDAALVAAAQTQAAQPVHPVVPGTVDVWQHMVLQRLGSVRGQAPPVFDLRPLPVAASYRLTVKRVQGVPKTYRDEETSEPFAALEQAWADIHWQNSGRLRYELSVAGQPVWALDVWSLSKPQQHRKPAPGWLFPVLEAARYRVRVTREKETKPIVETTVAKPWEPVTAVWDKIPEGTYRIEVQGVDAAGKEMGPRPWSAGFVKAATFNGPYFTKPARPYHEAALQLARWTADHATMGWFRGHGEQTRPAGDFGQSQIMLGAVPAGLVRHRLATDPVEQEAGLMFAIESGEVLRVIAAGRGGIPKNYKEGIANSHLYGIAFLDLHAATNDDRWRAAAVMVAKGYADSQLPNGTWAEGWKNPQLPERLLQANPVHELSRPAYEAGLIPGIHGPHLAEYDCSEVLWFLGRLRQELQTDDFRAVEDKAYRWVLDNSVKHFFWRDQGHHSPCMVPPFPHKGRTASYFALYLMEAAPVEYRDPKLAAEIMRFCEGVHLDWSRPDPATTRAVFPNLRATNLREVGASTWLGTRFAMVWDTLGRETGDALATAKARAFMDAATHAQHPVTGGIDFDLALDIQNRAKFAVNAGRCAWNLMAYGDSLAVSR